MSEASIPALVLDAFGLSPYTSYKPIGSGHIHQTYLVEDGKKFVLQRVNKNVFTKPEVIATNNRIAANYLAKNFPEYLFPTALPDKNGSELVYDVEGYPWRVYPLIENTITIDFVTSETEAFEAASGFGRLTRNLNEIDCSLFNPTLDRFHDLGWRYQQFEEELTSASDHVKEQVAEEIKLAIDFRYLVNEYNQLIQSGSLKQRVTHNDTKINNILFDRNSHKAVCVIDLDTLMPGYFIYDLGDMVRTCVSPVSEEERDVSKITFRKEIYDALLTGYLSEMNSSMTLEERKAIPFAGKMMTYIMALRFLADFLRGNTYYHITYSDQNKVRARNQFYLLKILTEALH
ncbi:MAG TPA: aminoglycoside phosphotransferase family protein [Cyclobacteriaceae bacterium]|nr:aminoglycoside phosphotransferase family protein [Cyclobacteriaceae bacterium]